MVQTFNLFTRLLQTLRSPQLYSLGYAAPVHALYLLTRLLRLPSWAFAKLLYPAEFTELIQSFMHALPLGDYHASWLALHS